MRYLGWALTQYDWCPYKKGRLGHRRIQRRTMWRHREKTDICKTERGHSSLLLDFALQIYEECL